LNKLLLVGAALFLSGCGYHLGSIMHPQVKSIAVAPVVNETAVYNAASEMRMMLCEQIMTDGSLELTDMETADCILQARILNVSYTEVTSASYNNDVIYRPTEWRIVVTMEFKVIIPGKREPLISTRTVTGNTLFQVQADLETNRHQATLLACGNAAYNAVIAITEAW